MERLQRERKLFGLELLYFFLLAFSRFFDHKLQEHPVPFSFMEHYGAAAGLTVIYLLLLFDLTGAALWLGRKMGETGRVCAERILLCSGNGKSAGSPFFCRRSQCLFFAPGLFRRGGRAGVDVRAGVRFLCWEKAEEKNRRLKTESQHWKRLLWRW